MSLVYWFSDGVGQGLASTNETIAIPTAMIRWIRTKGTPALIIYGGDVYPTGDSKSFEAFFNQMDGDVSLMCQTPGNHDWKDDPEVPPFGRIPHGYEAFWTTHASKQPVDTTKKGGARYEHFIDLDGWRLIFLDTGDYDENPWPGGDPDRATWLKNTLQPGRANILVAHHSRLSRGRHGDNKGLDALWKTLFDAGGVPRVAFTIAGHDHNVSMYGPRSRDNPKGPAVGPDKGIYVFVNGAGGDGHYDQDGFVFVDGTKPDIFHDDDNYCVTRISLKGAHTAEVDVLSFGKSVKSSPVPIAKSFLTIRV